MLVGKTLEQSLLEVLQEEELADLRQQQRMFEELRNAEMAEQQRLEEQDRRLDEEKVICTTNIDIRGPFNPFKPSGVKWLHLNGGYI